MDTTSTGRQKKKLASTSHTWSNLSNPSHSWILHRHFTNLCLNFGGGGGGGGAWLWSTLLHLCVPFYLFCASFGHSPPRQIMSFSSSGTSTFSPSTEPIYYLAVMYLITCLPHRSLHSPFQERKEEERGMMFVTWPPTHSAFLLSSIPRNIPSIKWLPHVFWHSA